MGITLTGRYQGVSEGGVRPVKLHIGHTEDHILSGDKNIHIHVYSISGKNMSVVFIHQYNHYSASHIPFGMFALKILCNK